MKISNKALNLGTESAFELLAKADKLRKQGRDIINLGIGQPDFLTPEHIVEAAIKALTDGVHGYTPALGIEPLRETVSEKYNKRYNVSVNPNNILITPGGKPVIFFATCMFGEKGSEILCPNPGFPIYQSAARFSEARVAFYPLMEEEGFSINADRILDKITSNTRLIILNTPHNPTGSVSSHIEIKKLTSGLMDYPNVVILSDEIYSKMHFGNLIHTSMVQFPEIRERVIILDGWSKAYAMTGWRLGYSIWPNKLIKLAERFAINTHSCVSGFIQIAGIAALEGSQDSLHEMIQTFERRRDVIVSGLNAIENITCTMPKGAFYAFPNIKKTGKSSQVLQNELLEQVGVALLSGSSFGSFGEGYLRISYANSLNNIETAIERIGNYFG